MGMSEEDARGEALRVVMSAASAWVHGEDPEDLRQGRVLAALDVLRGENDALAMLCDGVRVADVNAEALMLADGTNPWVQVDGWPIHWHIDAPPSQRTDNDCDQCGDVVDKVIESMDTPYGIQRCDNHQDAYSGDIEAAQVLADLVGGEVYVFIDEED